MTKKRVWRSWVSQKELSLSSPLFKRKQFNCVIEHVWKSELWILPHFILHTCTTLVRYRRQISHIFTCLDIERVNCHSLTLSAGANVASINQLFSAEKSNTECDRYVDTATFNGRLSINQLVCCVRAIASPEHFHFPSRWPRCCGQWLISNNVEQTENNESAVISYRFAVDKDDDGRVGGQTGTRSLVQAVLLKYGLSCLHVFLHIQHCHEVHYTKWQAKLI